MPGAPGPGPSLFCRFLVTPRKADRGLGGVPFPPSFPEGGGAMCHVCVAFIPP